MESDELPAHPIDINVRADDQLAVALNAGGFTLYKIIMYVAYLQPRKQKLVFSYYSTQNM